MISPQVKHLSHVQYTGCVIMASYTTHSLTAPLSITDCGQKYLGDAGGPGDFIIFCDHGFEHHAAKPICNRSQTVDDRGHQLTPRCLQADRHCILLASEGRWPLYPEHSSHVIPALQCAKGQKRCQCSSIRLLSRSRVCCVIDLVTLHLLGEFCSIVFQNIITGSIPPASTWQIINTFGLCPAAPAHTNVSTVLRIRSSRSSCIRKNLSHLAIVSSCPSGNNLLAPVFCLCMSAHCAMSKESISTPVAMPKSWSEPLDGEIAKNATLPQPIRASWALS